MTTLPIQRDRVEVWKQDHGWNHPYPWRFRVWFEGKSYDFGGIPNQCETKGKAYGRGYVRLRWLRTGEFHQRYRA